ncbi:MAG: PQQ-binding-like beta-propeller repeat protein [Halobacteriaceae archaeon]
METIRAALPFVLGSPFLATDDRILLPYSTTSGELGVASLTRDLTAPDPVDWRTHALTVHPIPGPQGAPAVACGILVGFADLDSGYAAVSLREGRDRWEHETAPEAVRTRPAVADGRVFLVASHPEYWTLTALDARTGERDWQTERPFVDLDCQWPVSAAGGEALVDMPPIVDGERVYVFVNRDIPTIEEAGDVTAAEMPASDRVVAFDTTTGDQLWSADLGGIGAYGNMSLSDDSLFVTDVGWSADEEFWSEVTVVALDPATGDERWRTAPLSGLPYSLVSTRDHVYLASGNAVHVVERQTGEVRQRVEYGEVLSRLVVVENHVIAYAREKNEVVVFEGSAGESG